MVRLQGDFAKPPEKRFNYKHCFDALYRVRWFSMHLLFPAMMSLHHGGMVDVNAVMRRCREYTSESYLSY